MEIAVVIVCGLEIVLAVLVVLLIGRLLRQQRIYRAMQPPPSPPPRDETDDRLLLRLLSPEQRAEYHGSGSFCVRTASGTRYRLRNGTVSNVSELDRYGNECARWCVQTQVPVPIPSLLMAQFLLLSTDEDQFRLIGQRTLVR